MYNQKVVDYFMNPRNSGRIEDASAIGEVGNPVCGDVMKIYLKINPQSEVIEDIKFETFGCAAAIATSSMITELAKGKTLANALKITNKDVADELGGLPAVKLHCSLLAQEGIQAAAADYYMKRDGKLPAGLSFPESSMSNGGAEEERFVSEDSRAAD
ncbi:iron-sulfur cluster assembly scaffold protein NifU [Synergistes jonesii]|uniref:Nitrogen fixation protein NifU n=1 Tax=Synergistes jonesii TaxID=2754 RepID=A0A073ITJ3_9BACT|nr:iron-sulfur cluster assembly scaffold protein NifU [Synergistes jonesii]KEJ92885.1 nitrogen fixation protein NifU [Synergistes jonesii]MDY2985981.1 iron-sulfur cluster assembly scaffold protein NifU [Synergistes jonesii]OFB64171.1 nitrogen fixation protein NifU [Synergistes jonesii]OFB64652.1 nitrogen fixation protein NifU [Synergistes jonesii]OFB65393.1 nitrogen fixation protein NifU [Synergistes jonesii]